MTTSNPQLKISGFEIVFAVLMGLAILVFIGTQSETFKSQEREREARRQEALRESMEVAQKHQLKKEQEETEAKLKTLGLKP